MAGFLNWDSAFYAHNIIYPIIVVKDSKNTMLYCAYLGFSGIFV